MTKVKNSDAFQFQRKLMTMTGLWPRRSPTIFYRLYGVIHYVSVVTFAGSLLLNTVVLKDFSQLIQSWSMFVAILSCSTKFSIFYFKMPAFLDLLDFLHSLHFTYYNEKYDPHLRRIIRFSTVMAKLFICSGVTTVLTILAAPLLNPQDTRVTPLLFPLNLNKLPFVWFVLVYVFQCFALFSAAWTSIGFDNLSTSMMGLCSRYFMILRKTIKEVTHQHLLMQGNNTTDMMTSYADYDQIINAKLKEYVKHDLAVIRFTKSIENIFTFVFLSQFVCSAAGICLVGFTFVNAAPESLEFIFALSFLGTLMFQITLYCSYGNEVTVQSAKIGDACYMTEWIYCGPAVCKTLLNCAGI